MSMPKAMSASSQGRTRTPPTTRQFLVFLAGRRFCCFREFAQPVSPETGHRLQDVDRGCLISVVLADFIFPALHFRWHAEDIAHFIVTSVSAAIRRPIP